MDNKPTLKELRIGDLTAKLPIIQGGMGVCVSLARLSSAVANEGGIGVIASVGLGRFEPDIFTNYVEANNRALRKEIRKARQLTNGLLGINIMVALSNFAELAQTAIDEGIDVIFSGAGLPLNLPQFLRKDRNTKLVPIVSSARAAKLICKRWKDKFNYLPDAIVVEGPLAGGHLGFKYEQIFDPAFSLENLVTEVIKEIKVIEQLYNKSIPVIAAGGIFSGEDIYNIFKLGVAGVQMATRFVTTHECDASMAFKQAYINAKKEDIIIIQSPVGLPGRAIRNKFLDDVSAGKKKPFKCPYRCIITCDVKNSPYCIALALLNAQEGKLDEGFVFTGSNAYKIDKILSVKELINSIIDEYNKAVEKYGPL
ncbi:MAG: nitronate monooxygenase family protein [Candidatus Hydrogenedentota bacterium]